MSRTVELSIILALITLVISTIHVQVQKAHATRMEFFPAWHYFLHLPFPHISINNVPGHEFSQYACFTLANN